MSVATTEPDPNQQTLRVSDLVRIAEESFSEQVTKITAPGGRGRASARIFFQSKTVIATYRPVRRDREREIAFLEAVHGKGAPVPEILGRNGDILFQEDLGNNRLTTALGMADEDTRRDLAGEAFESLWKIKSIVHATPFFAKLPVVALGKEWIAGFLSEPARLSRKLGIGAPRMDVGTMAARLTRPAEAFVKWDARPGNAVIAPDGRVVWFDWEHYGRRIGCEDFPFLFGDEFWTLDGDSTLDVFRQTAPQDVEELLPFLTSFTVLQIARRLSLIHSRLHEAGWSEPERVTRQDRIGTTPAMVQRLALHGADWAQRETLTKDLQDWFTSAGEAILAQAEDTIL